MSPTGLFAVSHQRKFTLGIAMFRIFSKIYIKNFLEIMDVKIKQPIVFKVKVEYLLFFVPEAISSLIF